MSTRRQGYVLHHPYCHLMNGERLHYLLIKTTDRNATSHGHIMDIVERLLGVPQRKSIYLYQVFGNHDMVMRIWCSKKQIHCLINGFRQQQQITAVTILLIKEMLTWYQQKIEQKKGWKPTILGDRLNAIVCHTGFQGLNFRWTIPARSHWIRFFVLCEKAYQTKSSAFDIAQKVIQTWPTSEDGKSGLLKDLSIYAYSNGRIQGVLLKGDFRAKNFEASSKSLTHLVNQFIEKHFATTTLIVSEHVSDGADTIIERRGSKELGEWRHIISNLLGSYESHPDYYADPVDLIATGPPLPSEEIEDRRKRAEHFDSIAADQLIDAFKHYHPDWWSSIAEARLIYRWVITGPEKDEQMIAVMMKGFAEMESELGKLICSLPCGEGITGLTEERRRKLREKLDSEFGESLDGDILTKICEIVSPEGEEREVLTLEPIAIALGRLSGHPYFASLGSSGASQKEQWKLFKQALTLSSKDRNDLMHGNVRSMFEKVPKVAQRSPDRRKAHDSKSPQNAETVVAWQRFVINYMRTRLLFPIALIQLRAICKLAAKKS